MPTRRRLALALVFPAVLLGGPLAGSASADVETPTTVKAAPGTLTFAARAQETTPITKVEVTLPVDSPMLDVTVPAVDGWTSAASTVAVPSCGAEAVDHVTWTATGAGIGPEGTGTFALQVGRFPAVDQLELGGLVTYADGRVVSWTEAASTTPARPTTPFLDLTPGTAPPAVAVSAAPRPTVAPVPATSGWMGTVLNLVTSLR